MILRVVWFCSCRWAWEGNCNLINDVGFLLFLLFQCSVCCVSRFGIREPSCESLPTLFHIVSIQTDFSSILWSISSIKVSWPCFIFPFKARKAKALRRQPDSDLELGELTEADRKRLLTRHEEIIQAIAQEDCPTMLQKWMDMPVRLIGLLTYCCGWCAYMRIK